MRSSRLKGLDDGDVSLVRALEEVECLIPHKLYGHLIGKNGFRVQSIIRKFGVQVIFPEDKRSEKIRIRGRKKGNCEKAKQALLEVLEQVETFKIDKPSKHRVRRKKEKPNAVPLENRVDDVQKLLELVPVVAVKVDVPQKYHEFIMGKKGGNVKELTGKHHVRIDFPPPEQPQDFITVTGAPACVSKAKKEIEKQVEEKKLRPFQVEIEINPDFVVNLTGLKRSAINKIIRDQNVQIIFPKEGDAEMNIITINSSSEKTAKAAKEDVLKIVSKLKKEELLMNKKMFKKMKTKDKEIRNVMEEYKVDIRFSENTDPHLNLVTMVGPEDNLAVVKDSLLNNKLLDLAKKVPKIKQKEEDGYVLFSRNRMEEKVERLDDNNENLDCLLEEVECHIPHDLFRELMNRRKFKNIICQFGVEVMFPTDEKSDKVIIRGRKNCEKAKKALLLLLETAVKVYVPCKYHGFIIGKKGSNVNELKEKHHVDINFPHPDQHLDHITISGLPAYVGKAKQEIEEHWKKIEDKELRSLQLKIKVDPEFYGPLIGKNGSVIKQIIWDRNVHIKFPKEGDTEKNIITITGYEEEAKAAKEDILKIVSQLEKQKKEQMLISREFCQELRGKKGKIDIQKLMQEFKVDIRFSDAADPDQSLVTIIGAEENPAKLKEYLQNEAFFTSLSKKALKKKEKKVKSSKNTTALAPLKNVVQKLLEPVPDIAVKVDVPQKYHEFIMGKKGGNMKELMRKHNVRIDIPPAEQPQDFITVTGAPACVSEAKKEIEKQIKEKELRPSQTKIEFDPDFLGYLKSLQGSVISQIIRDHSVEMKLPKEVDAEVNIITINSGNQKRAEAAKEDILKIVRKLKKKQVQMTKKKFREIKVKDEEIRKLMQEYKVDIRFSGSAASLVTIVGPDDNLAVIEKCLLDLAKKVPERLKEEKIEVVDDNNESIDCLQEEVECHIPYELFRELKKRPKFKDIVCQFGVEVMFPTDERSGIVVVRGRKNCEKALQKLLEQVESVKVSVPSEHQKGCNVRRKETLNAAPLENRADDVQKLLKLAPVVAVKVNVPQKYHEFIMGNKSGNMKELMRKHNVRIDIPPAEQQLDFITVTGMPACVSGANKEIEKQIEEKELRPFQIELEINPDVPDPDFLENLTGLQSSAINKIIRDYDVQIKFAKEGDAEMNIITINSSNQKTAEAAREDILKMVRKLKKKHVLMTEKMFRKMKDEQDSIQKVMQEYKVDIRFAGSLVSIVGPEDNLAVVKESLLNNTLLALAKKLPKIKQLKIEVDPDSLGNLIGPQRSVINQIIWDHDVQIKFPMEGDAEKNIITITGCEEQAKAAKEDILQIISKQEEQKKEQMLISTDNELCKELRGKKGKIDIQKLMHESKVDIRFSDAADPGQSLVTIIGVEENLAKV
ncbi:vigilin-like isoform X2 [Neocloeon triangulifer]|uniref:vigilin-like isoform X2 n=1 Tax=Neocloeon triangulifer TaxID=2078957 RepID=UPI00286F9E7D|nr:vigilin-like isoform X2 [Neocloeon triangulifer]